MTLSIAAPFVTGSAALMMEWGIVRGNDPYLYGDKLKAYLIKGARWLPGQKEVNTQAGWGALCLISCCGSAWRTVTCSVWFVYGFWNCKNA